MRNRPTLIIDLGSSTVGAMVVTDSGSWLVPDPTTGDSRWPTALHWDGQRMAVGAAAEQRGQAEPSASTTTVKRALDHETQISLGTRRLRPVEVVAELFAALRLRAQHVMSSTSQGGGLSGPLDRAVITIPASLSVTDPRRGLLVSAAETAGFQAVELLIDPAGAVWAPGTPLRVGSVALVYNLGATFEAALIRVGDDLPEVLGHASIVDWPADSLGSSAVDLTLACCRDLLGRLAVQRGQVDWVLPIGGGARTPGLSATIEHGLGIPVAQVDEPELAVVRGAAAWLPRSGGRTIMARSAADRMVPLVLTVPGGSAALLRWLVEPEQPYDEGAVLARVRLRGGAVWDLTARARGTIDEMLVPGGREVRTGEWLALVRPR